MTASFGKKGSASVTSKIIPGTVNPEWDEDLYLEGELRDFVHNPTLVLDVRDGDVEKEKGLERDPKKLRLEELGKVEVGLEFLKGKDKSKAFKVKLSTEGKLEFHLRWQPAKEPPSPELPPEPLPEPEGEGILEEPEPAPDPLDEREKPDREKLQVAQLLIKQGIPNHALATMVELMNGASKITLQAFIALVLSLLPGDPFVTGAEVYAYSDEFDWVTGTITRVEEKAGNRKYDISSEADGHSHRELIILTAVPQKHVMMHSNDGVGALLREACRMGAVDLALGLLDAEREMLAHEYE